MNVAFTQGGNADAQELGLLLQFVNGSAAAVAHSRTQATDQLERHFRKRTLVRHASLDPFRYKLSTRACHNCLRVALGTAGAAILHRTHGPHTAISFERPALVENGLSGTFVRSR